MLNNEEFDINPKCLLSFKKALKSLVDQLDKKEELYPRTLREYLNGLGEILFLEEENLEIAETKMVRFMAVVSEYLLNEEFRDSLSDVE